MPLSKQQVVFLKMAKSGTAPRSNKNRTGTALAKAGLIKFNQMYGWHLTPQGVSALEGES